MNPTSLETAAVLRLIVGFLGERANFNWWTSSFFVQGSDSFLLPLFPKTNQLARLASVTAAATALHDAHIGEGNAYHLFRLPDEQELALHRFLQKSALALPFLSSSTGVSDALGLLRARAAPEIPEVRGPIRIGAVDDIDNPTSWSRSAACYTAGFLQGYPVMPYFSGAS